MIRRLISLVILVVVALMGYNMFFGTEEDKARGQAVAKETKELVGSIVGFLKAEKQNYDSGKYEDAMKKLNKAFKNISSKAQEIGGNLPERVKELEEKKDQLDRLIEVNKNSKVAEPIKQNEKIEDEMSDILKELQDIAEDIDSKQ